MSLTSGNAEPDGHLLDEVEDRHEDDLRQDHPVAELRTGLRSGDEATNVGIGEHDHEAGTPYCEQGNNEQPAVTSTGVFGPLHFG